MSDRFKITWPVEKTERVWRRLRNCKNCINCPKRKYIKIKLNFPSFILALIHRVWQRASITGDNKFQWSRFASVNKTNLRHMLLTKIARLKPQILKKQPLRHEVHCIVYAPPISFRFSRVALEGRARSRPLGPHYWMLCCDWFGMVRYGNSLIEAKIANQRAALEWCWSTAIMGYTAVRLRPKGLQVYGRVGISLVEV